MLLMLAGASTWVVISQQKYHDMFLEKNKRDIFKKNANFPFKIT